MKEKPVKEKPVKEKTVKVKIVKDTLTVKANTIRRLSFKYSIYLPTPLMRTVSPILNFGAYIDFVRLRPKISDSIPGEHIKLSAEFSVSTVSNPSTVTN